MSSVKVDNIEKELAKLKPFLGDYLAEHGIDIRNGRKFKCINPEHDDRHPSMSTFNADDGTPLAHCFSCGFSSDIFRAAHVLEDKPIVGAGFIKDNVLYLAEKYGVEISTRAFTEEEIYEINTYEAYRIAAGYISRAPFNGKVVEEINRRGWNEEWLRNNRIGTCDDFNKMRSMLKSSGFSARFLDEIDLSNRNIFDPDCLIFTVCDDWGRPCGFAARNLNFDGLRDEGGQLVNGSKFNNTKTTGTKCNIYRKSERLFMLNVAKGNTPPLYIVEGYGDATTAHMNGITNVVAMGSVELSEHHFNTCRRNGIYDVIICLDNDKSGIKKARALLDEILINVHDMKIRFVFLPTIDGKKMDPDLYIREHGAEAFLKLQKVEPFEWRLIEFSKEETDPEVICFSMIPIIANEPSPIRRESMMKELSDHTGYSENVIKEELNKLLESEEAKVQKRREGVISALEASIKERKESFETALQTAIDGLYNIEKEKAGGVLTPQNLITDIRSIKEYQEAEELHSLINFGDNFHTLQYALHGDVRQKVILVGGTANTGKTTQFSNLAWNLAESNEDILPVVLTIDDSARDFIPRLITYDIAKRTYRDRRDIFNTLAINKIAEPFRFKNAPEYNAIMEERERSYKKLIDLVRTGNLVVLDSSHGRSVEFVRAALRQLKERNLDKRILLFLDNFHILDTSSSVEGREKYKQLSKEIKNIAVDQDMTIVSTVEYTKLKKGERPSNNNIGETVALEYDANAIIHLYNELHDLRDASFKYFTREDGITKIPIIEADVGKNKISEYKGTIFYKFFPEKAFYLEVPREQVEQQENANKANWEANNQEEESEQGFKINIR